MKRRIILMLSLVLFCKLAISQQQPIMNEPVFEDYILGDTTKTSFHFQKGDQKSTLENILLQCFINNQAVRKNQFFSDKFYLEEKHHITNDGYKHYWNEDLTINFSIREIDDNNTKAMKDIFSYYGFPKFKELEDITRKAIFLTLFYSNDIELLKNNIEKFYSNLVLNGFPSKYYAYLVDKLDFLENKPQTYGTCFVVNDEYEKPEIQIKDIENLDRRRAKINLPKYEIWKTTKEFEELGERKTLRDSWFDQKN